MNMNLKDKLGIIYSFNMIFLFLALIGAIIVDGFAFGLATASLFTAGLFAFFLFLIYKIHLCQTFILEKSME